MNLIDKVPSFRKIQNPKFLQSFFNSLCSEGEGCGCDGGGEAESLDDLLPLLLVDDLHQAATGHHQVVQLVQVQHLNTHSVQQ